MRFATGTVGRAANTQNVIHLNEIGDLYMYSLELFSVTSQILIGFSMFFGVMLYYRYIIKNRNETRFERKRYSIELCLSDNRVYENIIVDQNIPYYKQLDNEQKLNSLGEINEILVYFEKISIGINERIYDEDVLRTYYEKYFLMLYRFYKYYIMEFRNSTEAPFLYIEYEKYVKRWSESLTKNVFERRY